MDSTSASDLHMLFFPYMAQGHMLPMIDMAKVFSSLGATVTILTTPANSLIVGPAIDRFNSSSSSSSSSPISLHVIPFPSAAAGLPPGCENRSFIPSESLRPNFYRAVSLLRLPFDQCLRSLRPDAVVTDMFMPWTYQIATDYGIPRLLFDGTGFFSRCAEEAFSRFRLLESLPPESRSDAFIHPGLPHRFEMLPSQFPEFSKPPKTSMGIFDEMNSQRKEVDPKSYGVIVNSFYELEPDYVEHYRKVVGRKAWHVGPVWLCNENRVDRASRGRSQSEADRFLEWLDGKKKGSVVYICFGSVAMVSSTQLREMALGLEASGFPFLWVLPHANCEDWVPDGFQEKGMVVRGWAPQLLILNHEAVGGFVTHCGWNSVTEGIAAGLPMVTWPLYAEQFYNERLLVDVVKVGVAVGSKVYTLPGEDGELVGASEVEEAVRKVMGEAEEAEERRRRAREMGRMARRAVVEGGSSYEDARNLIRELLERKAKKVDGEEDE